MRSEGFTLVELVIVITVTAALAGMIASFITTPLVAYNDVGARATLVANAESAMRRTARDVQRALPNSLRIAGGGAALELLHVVDGARYRRDPGVNTDTGADHTAASDVLSFGSDASFNVLGRLRALSFAYGTPLAAGHRLAIYTTDATVWSQAALGSDPGVITPAGTTLTVSDDTDEDQIALSAAHRFALESPQARFYVVDGPVTFLCNAGAGTLTRYWGYTPSAAQPTDPLIPPLSGGSSAVLADRIASCDFRYAPGTSQRAGLVTLELQLTDGTESARLLHQVHVANAP